MRFSKTFPPRNKSSVKNYPIPSSKHYTYRRKRFKIYNNIMHTQIESDTTSEKKIYIPTYLNRFRIEGCIGSGSDLTLMHDSLFRQIKQKHQTLNTSEIPFITTFSDNNVRVKGKLPCNLLLNPNNPGIPIEIYQTKPLSYWEITYYEWDWDKFLICRLL
jgi:hypothetical protein